MTRNSVKAATYRTTIAYYIINMMGDVLGIYYKMYKRKRMTLLSVLFVFLSFFVCHSLRNVMRAHRTQAIGRNKLLVTLQGYIQLLQHAFQGDGNKRQTNKTKRMLPIGNIGYTFGFAWIIITQE